MRLNLTKFTAAIFCLAVLGFVLAAGPGRADVQAGVDAYKRGDYEAALREFVDLAETGDPRAQYNLAVMYLKGRGVEKDLARAFDLQRRAAESGLAAAQHGLAIMYYRGRGAELDYKQAAKWFRRAADRGFPTSQLNLGVMYFSGQGVERNDAEVVKWVTLAAAKGQPEALFRLGRMYERGAIFTQSIEDAIYWYGKSAERGHVDGEKQVKRLTALLDARQATTDIGEKDASGEKDVSSKIPAETVVIAKKSIPPRAPAAPQESINAPSPPQLAKTAPETLSRTGPESEPKPETRNWRVQLASFRTLREAERAWTNLTRKFAEEFEDLRPDIVRVDLGPKRGVYHRLRAVSLAGRDAAFAFCNRLKSKSPKQGCIPQSAGRKSAN